MNLPGEFDGSAPPWSPAGPGGGYAADERLECEAVVHVRAGHGDGERDALGIGQHVQLAALLAAIDRVRPGRRSPLFRERRPRRRSPSSSPPRPGPKFVQHRPVQPTPQAGLGPCREAAVRGGGRRAERRRQMPPGTTTGQRVHHCHEHGPLVTRSGPTTLRTSSGTTAATGRPTPRVHQEPDAPVDQHPRPAS